MPAERQNLRHGRVSISAPQKLRPQRTLHSAKYSQKINQSQRIYDRLSDQEAEIRLFTLLPGATYDAPLIGKLEIHALDICPGFEALSYFWGDPTLDNPIRVNNISTNVAHNLNIALRQLRDHQHERVLWIDALCINQDCTSERNHQVRLMYRVFSTAERVLIWLGEGTEESDAAIDLMIAAANSSSGEISRTVQSLSVIRSLLCRPWWTRVWVIQEVVLAKDDPILCCGRRQISWSHFNRGWEKLNLSGLGLPHITDITMSLQWGYLWTFRLLLHSTSSKVFNNPVGLFRYTKGFTSTDPRDKIYGCLGLMQRQMVDCIQPSYQKPGEQVFHEAVKLILQHQDGFMNFFSTFSFSKSTRTSIPSWVPDFTDQPILDSTNPIWGILVQDLPGKCYQGLVLSRRVVFEDEDRLLAINGLYFDKITFAIELGPTEDHIKKSIRQLTGIAYRASSKPLPPRSPFLAVRRTVDDIMEVLLGTTFYNNEERLKIMHKDLQTPQMATSAALMNQGTLNLISMKEPLFPVILPGRYFFTTNLGFSGMAGSPVRINDAVTILGGERNPVILRPRGASYGMVGAAYIASIMNGELVDMYHQGLLPMSTFKIR